MNKPTVVVLGGKGMLGTDVTKTLGNKDFEVLIYDLPEFDITCLHHVEKVIKSAELIINCAAYTNVDGAESDKDKAHAINSLAVGEIGRQARALDRYVLHISTDFVYDGTNSECYTEKDTTNPINYYGKSKLEGERLLQESGCRHAIVRLQWTYGGAGVNFVTKICQKAKQSESISVVNDQVGSPTPTSEAAIMLCGLLEKQTEGLFLFAAEGYASRFGNCAIYRQSISSYCESHTLSKPRISKWPLSDH